MGPIAAAPPGAGFTTSCDTGGAETTRSSAGIGKPGTKVPVVCPNPWYPMVNSLFNNTPLCAQSSK